MDVHFLLKTLNSLVDILKFVSAIAIFHFCVCVCVVTHTHKKSQNNHILGGGRSKAKGNRIVPGLEINK